MTKVLHIITRLDKGGSPEIALSIAQRLDRDRYEVKLISGLTVEPQRHIKDYTEKTGVKVTFVTGLRREINPVKDFLAFLKLYWLIKRENPDIVHTHTSKAGILGRWAAELARVPIIIHMPHGHVFCGYYGSLKSKFLVLLERVTAKITDSIITLTEIGKEEHVKYGIGREKQFIPIHNGIELRDYLDLKVDVAAKKRQMNLASSSVVVGVFARLEPIKGHRFVLEAAALVVKDFPELKVLVVGSGSLRERLEEKAKKLNLTRCVDFLGTIDDIREVLPICDIVVLPSLYEGFGIVLIEAQAAGKAVVATKVGGIPEVVKDGETGILVPSRDPQAMAEAIITLLSDKERCYNIGEAGRAWVAPRFSAELMVGKIEQLYQNLLRKKEIG